MVWERTISHCFWLNFTIACNKNFNHFVLFLATDHRNHLEIIQSADNSIVLNYCILWIFAWTLAHLQQAVLGKTFLLCFIVFFAIVIWKVWLISEECSCNLCCEHFFSSVFIDEKLFELKSKWKYFFYFWISSNVKTSTASKVQRYLWNECVRLFAWFEFFIEIVDRVNRLQRTIDSWLIRFLPYR